MSKELTFKYKDREYTLRFTRKSARQLEESGFSLAELGDKPNTMLPLLFRGAFRAQHSHLKSEIIDEIYELIDKEDLYNKLLAMYTETVEALTENAEDDEKNMITWGANF